MFDVGPSQVSQSGGGDWVGGGNPVIGIGGASKGGASENGGADGSTPIAGSTMFDGGKTTDSDDEDSRAGCILAAATRGAGSKGAANDVAGSTRKLGGNELEGVPAVPTGATPCTSLRTPESPDSEA